MSTNLGGVKDLQNAMRSENYKKISEKRGLIVEFQRKISSEPVTTDSLLPQHEKIGYIKQLNSIISDYNTKSSETSAQAAVPTEEEIKNILSGLTTALRKDREHESAEFHKLNPERVADLLKD